MPGYRVDLRQQRLDAVGNVDLIAGRAGGDKGDRRAVDGDGVARRETRRQRVGAGGARQGGRARDRRRRRRLVADDAAGRRAGGIEEIVAGLDRRRRDQRGVGERRDRRRQGGVEIRRRRRRRGADREAAGRRRRRAGRRQLNGLGGAVGEIEGEADVIARVRIAGREVDRHCRRRAGRSGHRGARQRRGVTEASFSPNGEPATSSATCTEVGVGAVITSRPRPLVP